MDIIGTACLIFFGVCFLILWVGCVIDWCRNAGLWVITKRLLVAFMLMIISILVMWGTFYCVENKIRLRGVLIVGDFMKEPIMYFFMIMFFASAGYFIFTPIFEHKNDQWGSKYREPEPDESYEAEDELD